jgi:hypothetical protein
MEYWKVGLMGFSELTEWLIGKIELTDHEKNK